MLFGEFHFTMHTFQMLLFKYLFSILDMDIILNVDYPHLCLQKHPHKMVEPTKFYHIHIHSMLYLTHDPYFEFVGM